MLWDRHKGRAVRGPAGTQSGMRPGKNVCHTGNQTSRALAASGTQGFCRSAITDASVRAPGTAASECHTKRAVGGEGKQSSTYREPTGAQAVDQVH